MLTLADQGVPGLGLELVFFRSEPRLDVMRQGEIHVVAAEEQVVANGDAMEADGALGVTLRFVPADLDQAEIGRAAADVADQDALPGLDVSIPVVAGRIDPGVEGGLRLFEEQDTRASPASRAASTVSSRAISSNDAGTVSTTSCSASG